LNTSKIREGRVLRVLFLRTAEQSWDFFHFLEIVTGWLVRKLANENLQQVINTESYENIEFFTKK
jgi:hypothetical protein